MGLLHSALFEERITHYSITILRHQSDIWKVISFQKLGVGFLDIALKFLPLQVNNVFGVHVLWWFFFEIRKRFFFWKWTQGRKGKQLNCNFLNPKSRFISPPTVPSQALFHWIGPLAPLLMRHRKDVIHERYDTWQMGRSPRYHTEV